jgi:hypothetical protein
VQLAAPSKIDRPVICPACHAEGIVVSILPKAPRPPKESASVTIGNGKRLAMTLASMNKGTATVATTAIVCSAFLVFAVFIWPTPYRYEKVSVPTRVQTLKNGQLNWEYVTKQEVHRINRFTGCATKVVEPDFESHF